jgi:16S rRNA (guanine527-N7)-methyltransferase
VPENPSKTKKRRPDLSASRESGSRALAEKIREAWQPGLPGFALSAPQSDSLADYLLILSHWNRIHSLTAIEAPNQQIQRHLIDALSVWPEVVRRFGEDPAIRVADIGSGMGVPGIVWAIVMPKSSFDLVERQQKKAAFLRHVVGRLGLASRVRVVEMDVRRHAIEPRYDLITSRAFAALPDFLALTRGIGGPNTWWAAMTGRQKKEVSEHKLVTKDNKDNGIVVEEIVPIAVPGLSEERHLIWARSAA